MSDAQWTKCFITRSSSSKIHPVEDFPRHISSSFFQELEKKCQINGIPVNSPPRSSAAIAVSTTNIIKQEPSSLSSSLNNPHHATTNPMFSTFDQFPTLDSLPAFDIVDEDSIDRTHPNGNINPNQVDPLASLAHDPFLSSTSFGFDNEMDIGGGFA